MNNICFMQNQKNKFKEEAQDFSKLKLIMKNQIKDSIENGNFQNLKNEIDIYEKLLKIGFFENEIIDETETLAQRREKLVRELEKRLKRLNV